MSWVWLLVALFAGMFIGYYIKDQSTEEYVSNVTMHKPKVKGRGNRLDADQVTEVHMQKMTRKERIQKRREERKNKQ